MLESTAKNIRRNTIESIYKAGSGHPGSSLSCVDILTSLFFSGIYEKDRDHFVLSKGHAAPALYAALAERGDIPKEELCTLRQIGSRLQGHPDRRKLSCLDAGTGALGQGLSISLGYALASKLADDGGFSYCLVGDGELQEGQCWEAIMAASALKVNNLVCIIDRNDLQNETFTWKTLPLGYLYTKFEAFGWEVRSCYGHDFDQLAEAFSYAGKTTKPLVIITTTIKGKGVSFMEENNYWHSGVMDESHFKQAMRELA